MSNTSKETVNQIAEVLSVAGAIRTRNMMGGYLVYLDEVLIGQINNDELHIKITSFGEKYAEYFMKVEPYPDAKLALRILREKLKNADWLAEFLVGTREELKK